jgi:hypothetical protein
MISFDASYIKHNKTWITKLYTVTIICLKYPAINFGNFNP